MPRVALPLTGACQCRAVTYRVRAAPLTLYCCHCTECQHQSASAFGMSCLVARGDLEVDWSALKVWSRSTDSGNRLDCHFCPDCGSRLFHVSRSGEDIVSVKAGSFDDRSWLKPIGHIWTGSAQPWFAVPDGMLSEAGDPDDMTPYIDRWREVTRGWFVV
jgi:hypothetical protein